MIFYYIFSKPIDACTDKIYGKEIDASEVEEKLDNYFKAVDAEDRDWWIKEEETCRERLGIQILNDEQLNILKNTQPGKMTIQGVHCYDILANL